MRRPRRIYLLLLLVFSFTLFGATDKCNYTWCMPGLFGAPGGCGEGGGGPGGGGGGPPPAPTNTPRPGPTATPTPTPLPLDPPILRLAAGLYSYGDTITNCTGAAANVVDPISIVVHIDQNAAFVLDLPLWPDAHIAHHGWYISSTGGQFFQSGHGVITGCAEGDISLADGGDFSSRYHTRGLTQPDVVNWGYGGPWIMTPLTPHYDQLTACGHAVPANFSGLSGYVAARNALISHWLLDAGAQHRYVLQASFWGNDKQIPQCDGERPQSDGWVYFLGMCEVHSAVVTPC